MKRMDTRDCLKKQVELMNKHNRPNSNGVIVLFKQEDNYEAYNEGSDMMHDAFGTERQRDFGCVRVTGFPHDKLDTFLPTIIRANYRVCIVESL